MPLPHPAFLAPLPVSPLAARAPPSRLSRPVSVGRRRVVLASRVVPSASSSSSPDPSPPCRPLLSNLRKVVRASALSTAFLLTSFLPNPTQSAEPRFTAFSRTPAAVAAPSASTSAPSSSSSDVEAAAMTLGAVTLGGLAMRVILTRMRDDDAAAEKLAAECKRLEHEETQRSLRVQRNKLESLDPQDTTTDSTQHFSNTSAPSTAPSESDLMSELRKRVEDLDAAAKNNSSPDADADADASSRNDDMRHNPIPDRGTGSALLERPDTTDTSEPPVPDPPTDGPPEEETEPDILANHDQQEMLKRMWNLSPPDKNE